MTTQNTLAKKILEIQKEIGTLDKGAVNPFFNSKYIDINGVLEVLTPELQKRGLLLTQPLSSVGDKPAITTSIMDVESGEALEETAIIPEISDPQKAGGCITYFRRYALISMFGFGATDDDANASSGKKAPKKAAPKTATKATRSNSF